jgi:hypothetical protein
VERTYYRHHHESSFFFPIALITVGVVWLLVNNGVIAAESLYRLIPLWPLLLVGGGLSLLLRRLWWPLAALMWLVLAGALVWALVYSPALLPRVDAVNLRHEVLKEPVGTAKSASVELNLSLNPTTIRAAESGSDLVEADIFVADRALLDVTGSEMKNVTLHDQSFAGPNFFNYAFLTQSGQPWTIGLTPKIPLKLEIDASTGSLNMDLTAIKLEGLRIEGSTGSMNVTLPASLDDLPFSLDASTGSVNLTIPDGTSTNMDVKASTGSITIDVPDGAGIQVNVTDSGVGSLNLPDGMEKVRGPEGEKEGLYENKAFSGSGEKIIIKLEMSTGSVTIR